MREHRQVLTPEQKSRKAEINKVWRDNNSEKLKNYQKNRWLRDKEKITLRKKKYAIEHPEIIKNRSRKYYEENQESIKRAAKEYRENNLESARARGRKYRSSPLGRLNMYKASAKERGYDFSLSTEEFNSLLTQECHYCGKPESMGVSGSLFLSMTNGA